MDLCTGHASSCSPCLDPYRPDFFIFSCNAITRLIYEDVNMVSLAQNQILCPFASGPHTFPSLNGNEQVENSPGAPWSCTMLRWPSAMLDT